MDSEAVVADSKMAGLGSWWSATLWKKNLGDGVEARVWWWWSRDGWTKLGFWGWRSHTSSRFLRNPDLLPHGAQHSE